MLASSELIDLVKEYNLEANVDLLKKAYMFAMDVHGVQKRASGIPYFCHPVEVACLLIELRLDVPTIIAGLLHDTQEDAGVTSEELEEIFGAEIAFLVDGVTKLSKINYPTSTTYQAENFQKFILAVSRDIRVLLIKLADRLNNMRTINNIFSIEKRKGIALETLRVYAPLAGRMGMSTIKDEMEDKAFHILHPEEYNAIFLRLNKIRNEDQDFIQNTIVELKEILAGAKIDSDISGREKKIYSIWKKMQNRNVSLERINDIMAFRIVVATVQQCYSTLGVIHTHFQIVPGKFKDYISIPKLNNYQSLHTTVIGPSRQAIEIQIRTKEMHQTANKGIAAHLLYKNEEIVAEKENFQIYSELKNMITAIQNSGSSEEIIHHSKLELFDNKVFCFTPKGDLIILPYNATAIDFAYEIHTAVGNTCAGVKVNGR